ncbi:hypothetical protein H8356DRAFT_1017468 [Neocallimastix lanati (nom. inval.)]|nr:hypothetical protein H8356DRAFT_1017468 [Neocallimastix sp. JGI-2020a]
MNNLNFVLLGLTLLINYAFCGKKGIDSSSIFLSKRYPFKYSEFRDLILFGDSYTTSTIDYETLKYDGVNSDNEEESKNWPLFLIRRRHPMNMWNFADSGAVVDSDIIPSGAMPMTKQYEYFEIHMSCTEKYSNWRSDQTLIGIWFGINDVMNKVKDKKMDSDEKYTPIIECMFRIINKLYDRGARHFIIFNVPELEDFVNFQIHPVSGLHKEVLLFNKMITENARKFQKEHLDTNVFVYNAYNELKYIMEHKEKYGYTITKDEWYHNGERSLSDIPNDYFWRDGFHPSKYVQEDLAMAVDDFLVMIEKISREVTNTQSQSQSQSQTSTNLNDEECWALKLNYTCCSKNVTIARYRDNYGTWNDENEVRCGLYLHSVDQCFDKYLGRPCAININSTTVVVGNIEPNKIEPLKNNGSRRMMRFFYPLLISLSFSLLLF